MKKFRRNLYKCTIIDTNYIYDIDNRKVICIIDYYNPILAKKQYVKGVAKCSPDDTYNMKKGSHIAETRAKMRLYQNYRMCLEVLYQTAINKYDYLISREKRHLTKLINT